MKAHRTSKYTVLGRTNASWYVTICWLSWESSGGNIQESNGLPTPISCDWHIVNRGEIFFGPIYCADTSTWCSLSCFFIVFATERTGAWRFSAKTMPFGRCYLNFCQLTLPSNFFQIYCRAVKMSSMRMHGLNWYGRLSVPVAVLMQHSFDEFLYCKNGILFEIFIFLFRVDFPNWFKSL